MKNIIFDLGGVVVEWNAKRVLETFKGNPILVNFVKENSLFLNDWQDYDRGDVTRQELIDKVALLSGCPPEDCNEFIEHVKHSLTPIPETEAKLRKRTFRAFRCAVRQTDRRAEFHQALRKIAAAPRRIDRFQA